MSVTAAPKLESESGTYGVSAEEPKKTCVVCGDKAMGYNFNAITCESCKAFFRRNALKKKAYKCRFSGDCEITVYSRRYCRQCRLRKCFRVGMLAELITAHCPEIDEGPKEALCPLPMVRKCSSQEVPFFDPSPQSHTPHHACTPPVFFSPYVVPATPLLDQSVCATVPVTETPEYASATPMVSSTDQSWSMPPTPIQQSDVGLFGCPNASERHSVSGTTKSLATAADPLIPLPKSVLMHLIDLCHRGHRATPSHSPADECPGKVSPMSCTGPCACGASIHPICEMSEDASAILMDEQKADQSIAKKIDAGCNSKRKKLSTTWTSRALQDIEHVIMTSDKNTSTALDLVPSGPAVEFPPDIDIWKLFRLEELLSANEILAPPRSGPLVSFADPSLAADMMDLAIRRTLEMLKCIGAFGMLSALDQIALFKGSVRELMCLRGLMVYEASVNSFRPVGYPHRYLRLDAMRRAPDGNMSLRNFFEMFHPMWRKCDPAMLCLSSLVVFEPTRPNLTDVDTVRSHQQFYRDLLKCYLRTMYSPLEAEAIFEKMLDRLRIMKDNLNRITPLIHIDMCPRSIEPLLIDILNSQ